MKKIIAYTASFIHFVLSTVLILVVGSPIYVGVWILYDTFPWNTEAYDWFLASIMLLTFVIFFKVGGRIATFHLDWIHKKEKSDADL